MDDIKKEFGTLEVITATLRGAFSDSGDNYSDVVSHVKKLMKSTSNQEASASDKGTKASTKKKKLKGFRTTSFNDKKDKKKGKDASIVTSSATPVKGSDGKEARSREKSFPDQNPDGESGFEVQKLNMADFLGT